MNILAILLVEYHFQRSLITISGIRGVIISERPIIVFLFSVDFFQKNFLKNNCTKLIVPVIFFFFNLSDSVMLEIITRRLNGG